MSVAAVRPKTWNVLEGEPCIGRNSTEGMDCPDVVSLMVPLAGFSVSTLVGLCLGLVGPFRSRVVAVDDFRASCRAMCASLVGFSSRGTGTLRLADVSTFSEVDSRSGMASPIVSKSAIVVRL